VVVNLTVIVKGEDGKLLDNAEVSVNPGEFTAKTNSNGEAALSIEGSSRYQVTVEAGDVEQTVPFYVIDNQSNARLEVNLQYFKEQSKDQAEKGSQTVSVETPWYQTTVAYAGYTTGVILLIIALILIARRPKAKKKHHNSKTKRKK
jgi:hypothetical protein